MEASGWRAKATLLFGTWQEALGAGPVGPFDAVYYDAFSEYYSDMRELHRLLPRLLKRPGGMYSYFNGLAADTNPFFHEVRAAQVEISMELDRFGWTDLDR